MMGRMRIARNVGVSILAIAAGVFVVWSLAIGPVAVWRVLTHGTTTVWDHLEYPARSLTPSSHPEPWPVGSADALPTTQVAGQDGRIELVSLLERSDTLSFAVIEGQDLVYEWHAPGHSADEPSMLFSVTKSVTSLLVGAAIDDGHIGSVGDPVSAYVPELADAGLGDVSIEDLLHMDSSLDYTESDNPFGIHVEFNYTADLRSDVLGLRPRSEPDGAFRYKSGDNAVLGLVLDRALEDTSITSYLERRLWHPLGAEAGGAWVTDHGDGLERTWCCLAVTATDLARLGALVRDEGRWHQEQLVATDWIEDSLEPGYPPERWPSDYRGSPLANYGYQWWLTDEANPVALGKAGQYLYIDRRRDVVVVRLGESLGDVPWLDVLGQVTATVSGR